MFKLKNQIKINKFLLFSSIMFYSCSKSNDPCAHYSNDIFVGKTFKITKITNRENNADITTEYQNSFPCTKNSQYQFTSDKCIVNQGSSNPCFPSQPANFETPFSTQTAGNTNFLTFSTYSNDTVVEFNCDKFTVVRRTWKQNGPTIYTPVVTFTRQ
jgi:hypothetical protein